MLNITLERTIFIVTMKKIFFLTMKILFVKLSVISEYNSYIMKRQIKIFTIRRKENNCEIMINSHFDYIRQIMLLKTNTFLLLHIIFYWLFISPFFTCFRDRNTYEIKWRLYTLLSLEIFYSICCCTDIPNTSYYFQNIEYCNDFQYLMSFVRLWSWTSEFFNVHVLDYW